MGDGRGYICKKCGRETISCVGVGFSFPILEEKYRLKVLNGELGKERQKLSSEYLHFEVNCRAKEYYCPNCKAIRTQYVLDTTFSEPTKEGLKPIVNVPYEHVCEKCHTKLKKYCGQQLLCEKCGGEVEPSGLMILWD